MTATDRAGNQTTQPFRVMEDTGAPTVTIHVPRVAPLRFWVSWLGQDTASGVRDYDVQYKVGTSGTWTSWLTNTSQTQAPFVGERDQSYYFRVQATDNVDNTSAWVEAGPVTVSAVTKYYYHGGQRIPMRQGDVVYYLHSDHLGSTCSTTDITGTLVTDFTFTGQRADSYIKLIEMGARWYDPQIGRWISPDSIIPNPANPQSLNRYSYVYKNPVRYFDSDGYCAPFCYVAVYGAFRLLPRESLTFGSRQLAQTGVPIARDLAAWDAQTTDQLWQAINGTNLEGNPLSTKERIDVGGEGYLNLLGEAATAVTVAEDVEVLWAVGKLAYQRAAQTVERTTGNALVDDVLENELSNVRTTVKPTYDPTLTDAYGLSSRGEFSKVGRPSMQAGRLEVVDTIIHEEVHQRLWARGIPGPQHNEEHIWNVSRRFTRMKGLGVAPSQLQNIPE